MQLLHPSLHFAVPLPTAGARVIIACRDQNKAEKAANDIRLDTREVEGAGHVVVVSLDLSSLTSVRQCAQHLLRTERNIHILVNNAGKDIILH
jgi:NAD(P)-dependent dehydrogenase (short-subunit alcohol dehydrogenase family)